MSHISTLDLRIEATELEALGVAAARCGLVINEAIKFNWWGMFAGDTPESQALIAAGISPREYEKCAFTLSRKDAPPTSYNIGVVKLADGSYELRFDSYGSGAALVAACAQLKNEFVYAVSEDYLLKEGYEVDREVDADGAIYCVGRG